MKKLFTTLAVLLTALCANAQDITWNFSTWTIQTFSTETTIDGLTVVATADKTVSIDGSNKTVDGVAYTQRLKFGGTGNATTRHLKFQVEGKCKIDIILCSSSSTNRTLNIYANSYGGTTYTTLPAAAGDPTKQSFEFSEKGTVYLGSANSGVNIYAIYVTYLPSDFTLTTADNDYYSVYLDYDATIPAGVTAYTGKLNADESKVNVAEITGTVLPKNTAVLVKTAAAGDYTFAKTEDTAAEITENDLKGVTAETAATDIQGTDKTALTLGTLNDVVAFRKPQSGKLEANKAYILVSSTTANKMSAIGIGTGEGTTGVNGITNYGKESKAATYNIAGQRVNNNAKGLLIRDGKKFIRK